MFESRLVSTLGEANDYGGRFYLIIWLRQGFQSVSLSLDLRPRKIVEQNFSIVSISGTLYLHYFSYLT